MRIDRPKAIRSARLRASSLPGVYGLSQCTKSWRLLDLSVPIHLACGLSSFGL